MKTLTDYQIKYTKYKWEFLRGNHNYIEDWEKLQDSFLMIEDLEMKKEIGEFCHKWKLGDHLNPNMSYDDYIKFSFFHEDDDDLNLATDRSVLMKGLDLHRLMYDWLNPEIVLDRPVTILDGWAYEHDGETIHQYVSDKIGETE